MCELEPPIFAVPHLFVIGLKFMELSVSIKYLQEDILWEFIVMSYHPMQPVKTTSERPLERISKNMIYRFVRRALAEERVNIMINVDDTLDRSVRCHAQRGV